MVTDPRSVSAPKADPRHQLTGSGVAGALGGGKQTTAYTKLSMNEGNPTGLAANVHGISGSTASLLTTLPGGRRLFMAPTLRHACGSERQRLRDDFNKHEIA